MVLEFAFDITTWAIANPELGWIIVGLYLIFEIRTRYGRIAELYGMILSIITVVRALARVHDEVDTEKVDEYLLENGTEPGDFIQSKEDIVDEEQEFLRFDN